MFNFFETETQVYSTIIFLMVYLGGTFLVSIALYLLNAVSVYKMSQNMGLKNAWLSFIPVANSYALGRVAQSYVKNDGTPSAKFGKILLTLEIITSVSAIAFIVGAIYSFLSVFGYADNALVGNEEMTTQMVSCLLVMVVLYLVVFGVAIADSIVHYVAIWRTFALYDYHNATLYLVLSIFFSFLCPIFLFVLRNKQPKFTFEERMNISQN